MPLGSFLPCFYLRYSHHWVGGFSPCIWGFLRHRVHYGWREAGGAPPSSHRHLYCVQGHPVLRLQSGPGVAVPSWLQGQDPGPHWCCYPVTCGHGCRSGWEARDVFCFPGCYWVLKPWVQIPLPGVQSCRHWLCFSLSYTPSVCSNLPTVRCTHVCSGLYWHPIMLGMFYWLWIEEERQK